MWRRTNDDSNSSWIARSHLENHSTARRCSNDPSRWNPCWWLAPRRDVVVDANLVNFAGALLPGRHYDREIRLTNRGDAACAFAWRGQDDLFSRETRQTRGTESVLVYPPSGTIAPGESTACVVELVADDASRCDRTLVCVCEHGPELFVRVTAEVEGPEVVFAQSSLDFGLLQRGVPGDAYLVLRNASPVPAAWTLEEKRHAEDATARGEIIFSASRGVLPPHAEVEVECTLTPSEEGAYRGVVSCVAGGGRVAVVDARAGVLRPRCALSETLANLGVCHVGVAVEREVVVQNMTMLPAVFRWARELEGNRKRRRTRSISSATGARTSYPGRIASGSVQIHALQTVPIVRRHRRVRRGRRRETTRVRGRVRDSRLTRRVRHLQGRRSGARFGGGDAFAPSKRRRSATRFAWISATTARCASTPRWNS